MKRKHTQHWLDLVIHFLGSGYAYRSNSSIEDELDDSFTLNFENLHRESITSLINQFVLPDPEHFYSLFDSFKGEVESNFDSTEALQMKQQYATWISEKLYTIKLAANRLKRALVVHWELVNDCIIDNRVLHTEIEIFIHILKKERYLKELANRAQTHEEVVRAKQDLASFMLNRKEKESYFYIALWTANQTLKYLDDYGFIDIYKKIDNHSPQIISPNNLASQLIQYFQSHSHTRKIQSTAVDLTGESANSLTDINIEPIKLVTEKEKLLLEESVVDQSKEAIYTDETSLQDKSDNNSDLPRKDLVSLSQRQLALYYVYLHETRCLPSFEEFVGGKVAAIKHALEPLGRSCTPFQKYYNGLAVSLYERTKKVSDLEAVIPFLKDYPKAVERATDELKKARIDSYQSR